MLPRFKGPTPEATLPAKGACGPGVPVRTLPPSASRAQPSVSAGEPPGCGGEELHFGSVPHRPTGGAREEK